MRSIHGMCESCANKTSQHSVTGNALFFIRDWVDARGCDAASMLASLAKDATWLAEQEERAPLCMKCCHANAPHSRKAAKQYALAAWACRRLQAARDANDRVNAAGSEAFAGLPLARRFDK